MAKAAWCVVNPMSGEGNKAIAISGSSEHTGRVVRSTTVTVQNQSGAKPSKAIAVSQAAKALFITKLIATPTSIPASGGIITVTGKSNARAFTIGEASDRMSAHELKINGVVQAITNNDPVAPSFVLKDDPGAISEYSFEYKVTIPPNTNTYPYSEGNLAINAYSKEDLNESNAPYIVADFTQAGVASTLLTDKASIDIVTAGTVQNVAITSNDSWVVS